MKLYYCIEKRTSVSDFGMSRRRRTSCLGRALLDAGVPVVAGDDTAATLVVSRSGVRAIFIIFESDCFV